MIIASSVDSEVKKRVHEAHRMFCVYSCAFVSRPINLIIKIYRPEVVFLNYNFIIYPSGGCGKF